MNMLKSCLRRVAIRESARFVVGDLFGLDPYTAASIPAVNRAVALSAGAADVLADDAPWLTEPELLAAVRARLSAADIAAAGPFGSIDLRVAANLCRKHWAAIQEQATWYAAEAAHREAQLATLREMVR